jgi:hypothetical protein
MRGATRLLLLKLAAAIVPIVLLVAAMHFLLPGLAQRREQERLGPGYVLAETERLRIWLPRETPIAPLLAEAFERYTDALYAEYGEPLSLEPLEAKTKITLLVFASHDDLVAYASGKMRQDLSHAEGFYDPVSWSIAVTLRPLPPLLAVLFHEATHLLMDRSAGRAEWSPWLAEGLAVFFERSTVAEDAVRPGGVSRSAAADVAARARRRLHVPLRDLIAGEPEVFRSERAALCYREAGLLVAYLLRDAPAARREAFLRYYDLERQPGPPPPGALEDHLGISLDALETEWLAYLQGVAG